MAERTNADHGLIDGITAELGCPRTTALLSRLDATVPWTALVKPVAALPEYKGGENGSRPPWPAFTMLKCVMVAQWFGLSDPQLEECLEDRLLFRRFVGLSLTDATPDQTTFVRVRARLRERGLERRLFDDSLRHRERLGLQGKEGTLVDVLIVEQTRGRSARAGPARATPRRRSRRRTGRRTTRTRARSPPTAVRSSPTTASPTPTGTTRTSSTN